jgi:hypothetical protein
MAASRDNDDAKYNLGMLYLNQYSSDENAKNIAWYWLERASGNLAAILLGESYANDKRYEWAKMSYRSAGASDLMEQMNRAIRDGDRVLPGSDKNVKETTSEEKKQKEEKQKEIDKEAMESRIEIKLEKQMREKNHIIDEKSLLAEAMQDCRQLNIDATYVTAAQCMLGNLYFTKYSAYEDAENIGRQWIRLAAGGGNTEAQILYGEFAEKDKMYDAALKRYEVVKKWHAQSSCCSAQQIDLVNQKIASVQRAMTSQEEIEKANISLKGFRWL